ASRPRANPLATRISGRRRPLRRHPKHRPRPCPPVAPTPPGARAAPLSAAATTAHEPGNHTPVRQSHPRPHATPAIPPRITPPPPPPPPTPPPNRKAHRLKPRHRKNPKSPIHVYNKKR